MLLWFSHTLSHVAKKLSSKHRTHCFYIEQDQRGGPKLGARHYLTLCEFADGHLFWANPLPLSRLEMRVRQLAPRASAPIVVMDGGRIVERGAHRELLAKDGVYAQMWAMQQQEETAVTA